MEVAGLSIGVLSLLAMFETSCRAYKRMLSVQSFGPDMASQYWQLRIEEVRFTQWGEAWGVTEGLLDKRLDELAPYMHEVVAGVLTQIQHRIDDSNQLLNRYSLSFIRSEMGCVKQQTFKPSKASSWSPSRSSSQMSDASSMLDSPAVASQIDRERHISARATVSNNLMERFRWVISHRERCEQLVNDLRMYNDSLEKILPATTQKALLRQALRSELLGPTDDLTTLDQIRHAASLAPHGSDYASLAAAAKSKCHSIQLEAREEGLIRGLDQSVEGEGLRHALSTGDAADVRETLKRLETSLKLSLANLSPGELFVSAQEIQFHPVVPSDATAGPSLTWATATFAGDAVFVEYKPYEDSAKEQVFFRVIALANRLYDSPKPPGFHFLDCVSVFEDARVGFSRFGVVFKYPTDANPDVPPFSLFQAYADREPTLAERFQLAYALAEALLALHTTKWLHQAIQPYNILFFPPKSPSSCTGDEKLVPPFPPLPSPYLTGFSYARPAGPKEYSLLAAPSPAHDLYRHPHTQLAPHQKHPYIKPYDIYSLGLVFLEIGYWRQLRQFYARYAERRWGGYGRERAEEWRTMCRQLAREKGLSHRMGEAYQRVVVQCLEVEEWWDVGVGGGETGFWRQVVRPLQKCAVAGSEL